MTVSLVLAVRDRAEQLAVCLHTLLHQSAPASQYEVVIVDDGSGRPVRHLLKHLQAACALTVCVHESSRGRAAARNTGWRAAAGDIVVFLDADILAQPTLVEAHRRLHAQDTGAGPLAVSGSPWLWCSVFTVDYPEFSPKQRAALGRPVAPERPTPLVRAEQAAAWPAAALADEPQPVRPLSREAAPFLAFVTRDVSVRREVLLETAGFWEGFPRYGLADWEFGYRLHRCGARFVGAVEAACLHQEHPTGAGRDRGNALNYALVLERHPDPETALMALCPPWRDPPDYARLCAAYHRLRGVAGNWCLELDAALLTHAGRWAAWAGRGWGVGPGARHALPPPRDAQTALACWGAWRDPVVAPLLEALGVATA